MTIRNKHAGKTTVGFVMIPMDKKDRPTPYSDTGHTAIVVRIDGKVVLVQGWVPWDEFPKDMYSVPGMWQDDDKMLDYKDAHSFEFEVPLATANAVITFFKNRASDVKWYYHYAGKKEVEGERSKNCVQAAINVLAKEQPDEAVRRCAKTLKQEVKNVLKKVGAKTGGVGYSQDAAIVAARALWPQ